MHGRNASSKSKEIGIIQVLENHNNIIIVVHIKYRGEPPSNFNFDDHGSYYYILCMYGIVDSCFFPFNICSYLDRVRQKRKQQDLVDQGED